jgi:hypothetical protein
MEKILEVLNQDFRNATHDTLALSDEDGETVGYLMPQRTIRITSHSANTKGRYFRGSTNEADPVCFAIPEDNMFHSIKIRLLEPLGKAPEALTDDEHAGMVYNPYTKRWSFL